MLAPGYVIGGRYRLVRLLGEGGMGVVWSAVNDAFGREVAIKVMLPGVAASDPTAIERFHTEARICGGIRHPGIVDVLDVGRAENGAPFLVMELLDGDSLDTILHRAGTLRPLDILPVLRDVAHTLSLAHDKGVIHRDLKPGNVFLHRLPNGQIVAKVLDFGVSKVAGVAGSPTTRTRADTVVGSPAYMSPEQAGGRLELDPRSDVYAIGVIIYEALAGRLPFLEQNYNALMIDIAVRDPPPLGTVTTGLPKPVLDLVKAAMAHERDARLPSAAALAERIEAAMVALGASTTHALPDPASLGAGATPPSSRRISGAQTSSALATNARIRAARRSSPWLAVAVALGVVAAGGAGLWLKLEGSRSAAAPALPPESASVAPAAIPSPVVSGAPGPSGSATAPAVTSAGTPSGSAVPAAAPASASGAPSAAPRKLGLPPVKNKGVWTYD